MQSFPSGITFKFPWRPYQERVLSELDAYFSNDDLHLIAPPGSGKTVLGLEVALRLNNPTLILAPTITIRNQWVQRFTKLFLQTQKPVGWISKDIREPKFLTVSTYQGLHAACKEEQDELDNNGKTDSTAFIKNLDKHNIGTIVVDEAHHLKNAWWESVMSIKNELSANIVGLTATPPYDVPYAEWQRYLKLCGPVDTEISVPELVAEENLCPHQDYVYFSRPTRREFKKIEKHRQRIEKLFHQVKDDATLADALEEHPFFQNAEEHLNWIYKNLEYFSAILIFLNETGRSIPDSYLEIIGDKGFSIPELNYAWIELVLTFYLYEDEEHFEAYREHQETLINKLKNSGAITKHAIHFRHHKNIHRSLSSSISKLKSIRQIVDFEHKNLGQDLRMVILTDYIRGDFLLDEPENDLVLNKMGVVPIFEKLRRTHGSQIKLGVLTGSLLIIPATALGELRKLAKAYQVDDINAKPLAYDSHYLQVDIGSQLGKHSVAIITKLFKSGAIEVLTGTKALLGEGWDAPFINALVLASFVGSYVLTNQMRGRAIRTERGNPKKTSNIWHLVCIDPTAPDGGEDIRMLNRRLKAFIGVSFDDKAGIANGTNRLNLPTELDTIPKIDQANADMLARAAQRELLHDEWMEALENGTTLIEDLKKPFPEERGYTQTKKLYYNKTIAYLVGLLGSGFLFFVESIAKGMVYFRNRIQNMDDLFGWLTIVSIICFIVFGVQLYRTGRIYLKYRDIGKDIKNIAQALLQSLIHEGTIKTDESKLNIYTEVDEDGAINCRLEGGTTYEKSSFIKSLEEIVSAVESPRYIITRRSMFLDIIGQKDYHAVPEILGKHKKTASLFHQKWKKFVGFSDLIFTQSVEGRKLLLKSRIHSLSAQFEDKTERVSKWK